MTEPALRDAAPATEPALRSTPPRFSLAGRLAVPPVVRVDPHRAERRRARAGAGAARRGRLRHAPALVGRLPAGDLRPAPRRPAGPRVRQRLVARLAASADARWCAGPGGACAAPGCSPASCAPSRSATAARAWWRSAARCSSSCAGACRACGCCSRRRRALGRARTGSDYLREIVHQFWDVRRGGVAGAGGGAARARHAAQGVAPGDAGVQRAGDAGRDPPPGLAAVEPARDQHQHGRRGAGARDHAPVPARGRGAHRAPPHPRAADLPLSRGARGVGPAAAAQAPGAPAHPAGRGRARGHPHAGGEGPAAGVTALAPGRALLRRDGGELPRHLLLVPRVRLQPHLAAPVPGLRVLGARQGADVHEAAPGRAGALPPQPLRLRDPLLHLPPQLHEPAAHRRRHQPVVLAARSAVPRRRRVLHPPLVRRQRALQGGLPHVPRRSSSARATRRSSSSKAGAAAPARSSRRSSACCRRSSTRSRRACGATSTWCRCRSTTAASSRRRRTSASSAAARRSPSRCAGLVRARRVLQPPPRHGVHHLRRPDLAQRRARRAQGGVPPPARSRTTQERKRRFVQKLGFRLLREVNDTAVAGATSVSATVLLGLPHRACRLDDFVTRARALVRYLRTRGVRFTASLERNDEGDFRENLAFLESGGLIQRLASEGALGDLRARREASGARLLQEQHDPLLPAAGAGARRARRAGCRGEALRADVAWWLDLLRWEFPLPERDDLGRRDRAACAAT